MIHGTLPNYGWLLKMDVENNDKHDYDLSSATTPTERPKLVIQYATAASVAPEWADKTYTYCPKQPHAVMAVSNGAAYEYDDNGNMTLRVEGGNAFYQSYNVRKPALLYGGVGERNTSGVVVLLRW